MLINKKVDSIIFDGFGQACPNYPGNLCDISRKPSVKNEVSYLTALAGSIATLTINYTSSVLPPFTLFLSQYGIHTKPFLHLINCLCNRSLLFFQVTLGPCKIVCLMKKTSGLNTDTDYLSVYC